MVDKDTCHRCGSYVSLSGYCDDPECVYSFKKSREYDALYGVKHTPPFPPRTHEEQAEIERRRNLEARRAYEEKKLPERTENVFVCIVSFIMVGVWGYLAFITLDGPIADFFNGGRTGVFYPILGAILTYFALASLKAAISAYKKI